MLISKVELIEHCQSLVYKSTIVIEFSKLLMVTQFLMDTLIKYKFHIYLILIKL